MISGSIICKDEEKLIEGCLNQLLWTNEIIIIDDNSIDKTIEIVQEFRNKTKHPIKIIKSKFDGRFNDQRNLACQMSNYPWIFFLDADETIESGLIYEIKDIINSNKYDGISIPRINYVDGKRTKVYPDYQLRCHRIFCRYLYAVHEELVGCRRIYIAKYHYIHTKSSERFYEQQRLYGDIKDKYKNQLRFNYEQW